ncbi:hypothetical protein Fmac_025312 [Flemingia macrophylla]|uniref:Leucine-rich repeat domain, L domain-containing protein n=1 Tax=Flemingia macrophylla TaxID=520843 RepID=A0ABD1LRX2_9FABA
MLMSALSLENSLESLYIYGFPNTGIPVNSCFNFLESLWINMSCDSLKAISLDMFPKLSTLGLRKCRNLQMILQGHTHHHLKSLKIIVCPQFESFPSNGLSAPSLESLRIEKLEKLTSLPGGMHDELPCLTRMDILECPQLEMFYNGRISSSVKLMGLSYRSKLFASLRGALGPNPTLDKLSVYNVDAESFPDEGLLPPSLTSLSINFCPNLNRLDYKGLWHLSSLKELLLDSCPSLQCLPEDGLPKSISKLNIWYCPMLKLSCQEGDDRAKIAHIEDIGYMTMMLKLKSSGIHSMKDTLSAGGMVMILFFF